MIHAQNIKSGWLWNATTIATDSTTSAQFDGLGYHYATIDFAMGAASNTSAIQKMTSLVVAEADDTTTSYTNVSGLIGTTNTTAVSTGTAQEFTLVANVTTATATNNFTRVHIDLRKRKRYITCVAQTPSSNNRISATYHLTRDDYGPKSAADLGFGQRVIV